MSQPLISVIVPVYKVEKYLARCVESIRSQTHENLEIILVNDGSPDRCGEMCDALAAEDSRIRVVHKENGGLSSARNAGLDVMTGDYVGFVDSDDWIEPDMYGTLLRLISTSGLRIAACGMVADHRDGRSFYTNPAWPTDRREAVFTLEEALVELTKHEKITNSVCDKLFHRSVFESIRMTVGTVNEDFEIMPHCLEKAGGAACTPAPMYHYVMTGSSIMRGRFKASRFTESDMSRKRAAYYGEKYPHLQLHALAGHAEICLNLIFFSEGVPECREQRQTLIKELSTVMTKPVFRLLSRKNQIKYLLCRISPWLYSRFMRARSGQ